jgi:hypothetical protein
MYYAVCCCSSNESERVTRTREKGNAMLDDVALMNVVKDSYVNPFLTDYGHPMKA